MSNINNMNKKNIKIKGLEEFLNEVTYDEFTNPIKSGFDDSSIDEYQKVILRKKHK